MSSAGIDTNVNIIINAEDNASSIVNSSSQTIEQRYKTMRSEVRRNRMEFELNHRGLLATARAVQSVGMVVNRAISLYNSWNLMQLRIQVANKNLADSQRDVNRIIDEYGFGSSEHNKALEEEARLKKEVADASRDAQIQFAFMVASIIADSVRIATVAIPRFRTLLNLMRQINSTRVIPPTTPIGTPAPTTGRGGGIGRGIGRAGALGAGGIASAGALGAIGGYMLTQDFINPELAKHSDFYAKQMEKSKQGDQYIINLVVNSWAQVTQALDNFKNTFSGGQ